MTAQFDPHDALDASDLTHFGYKPTLKRSMGPLASFSLAFSAISISTAGFFLFSTFFTTVGGAGVWLWLPVGLGVFVIVLVYAHLAARMPITGYAYQWNSRLVNPHYGWFTGWTAVVAFSAGAASVAFALASIFAPEIWGAPTALETGGLAGVAILAAVLLNIISIRVTAFVNNLGVAFEILGSVGAALLLIVGVIFFFPHSEGLGILTQLGPSGGGKVTWVAVGTAALLPVYTLLGWEGSADLAEETHDPRRVAPYAMIRANYTSVAASLLMIIAFMIAIPHGVPAMLAQSENPMVYIFRQQLGNFAASVLEVLVFVAVFSCLLANVAVAVRVLYSLARDNMLPASHIFSSVGKHTGTPTWCIILIGCFAMGVNLLSADIANNVISIVNVAYYITYSLTMIAVITGASKGIIPEGLAGGFGIGKWLVPAAVAGLLFALIIIVDMTVPAAGHVAAEYTGGAEALGLIWYVAYVRRRLIEGTIGPHRIVAGIEGVPAAAE